MTATALPGAEAARAINAAVADRISAGTQQETRPPRLAVVSATDDEASAWYVRSIARAAGKLGIDCPVTALGPDADERLVEETLRGLSADPEVHAVMLQTPLPAGHALTDFSPLIAPEKDVDGANPLSLGRLTAGLPAFAPATAEAVLRILDHHKVELAGKHVVVVGRSLVVGRPLLQLLLDRDATVTVCHSRSVDLESLTRSADVLVVAVGRAGLITPKHVAPGTVVVDVGTNPTPEGGLVGDVAPEVAEVAAALTPVPGGVGPVTTAVLMEHVLMAWERAAAG
jgi:methylenetetrahydrofolate dehydrogenase (NADP+)/methenyltetrahydrofolate cyclohydrolase